MSAMPKPVDWLSGAMYRPSDWRAPVVISKIVAAAIIKGQAGAGARAIAVSLMGLWRVVASANPLERFQPSETPAHEFGFFGACRAHLYALDARSQRSAVCPSQHIGTGIGGTSEHCLDASLKAVANPAGNAALDCLQDHALTKSDALDAAVDGDMQVTAAVASYMYMPRIAHARPRWRQRLAQNGMLHVARG